MRAAATVVALALCGLGCTPPTSSAEVLLDFEGFKAESVGPLEGVRVLLDARDEEDRAVRVRVQLDEEEGEEPIHTITPVPMRCEGGTCALGLELSPGSYTFQLHVIAKDRCGTEGQIALLLANDGRPIELAPYESKPLVFSRARFDFDPDGDAIENILEVSVCGRFDVPDADRPPRGCKPADHPCCRAPATDTDLVGRMTFFAGGPHLLATGEEVTVAPFYLDATEVTYGAFERCVAAGACLRGEPDHPVRVALRDATLDRRRPVVDLTPFEAHAYCAWRDKALVTDLQWDFAAAHRGPDKRARYPWDLGDLGDLLEGSARPSDQPAALLEAPEIGCAPTDSAPAANHRGARGGCPRHTLPVGSYPQSHAHRGDGPPIADLAGNAYEWTWHPPNASPSATLEGPSRDSPLSLRGGYYDAPPTLLRNDRAVRLDASRLDEEIERLRPIAGFRCARSLVRDDEELPAHISARPPAEPVCPGQGSP